MSILLEGRYDPLNMKYYKPAQRRIKDFAALNLGDRYDVWQFLLQHFNHYNHFAYHRNFRKGLAKFQLYEHTLINYDIYTDNLLYTDFDIDVAPKNIILSKKLSDCLYLAQRWGNIVCPALSWLIYKDEDFEKIVLQDHGNYCELMLCLGKQIKRAYRDCKLYMVNTKYSGEFVVDENNYVVFRDIENCAAKIGYHTPYWGVKFFYL